MADLSEIVRFCDERVRRSEVADFPGSENGLQIENNGKVSMVGAAVDAGLVPFQKALAEGVDFLIVHHGLYWMPPVPLTRGAYRKIKLALDHNLAVYGAHLPLDGHPEIGNNVLLAKALGLEPGGTFLPYEGTDIGLLTAGLSREELRGRLQKEFPAGFTAIEHGSESPETIAILTGSGQSAVSALRASGADTLITGELKQHHFNMAQELGLNLYCCGHYATEVYGVKALAAEVAAKFGLEWTFLDTACPL